MRKKIGAAFISLSLVMALCACGETAKTNTGFIMSKHCIGRHSLKLPEEFQLSLPVGASLSRTFGGGRPDKMEVEIIADQVTISDVETRVKARLSELLSYSTETTDLVKKSDRVGEGEFIIRVNKVDEYYSSELHLHRSGTYLKLTGLSRHDTLAQIERDQLALTSSIRHVSGGEENPSGFCVGNIAILGVNASESSTIHFRSKKRADLLVEVTVDSYAPDDRVPLLERVNGSKSLFRFLAKRPRVIRQGERIIAGMKAQEWLAVTNVDGLTQYILTVETYGRSKVGPETPKIHLELRSGQDSQLGRQVNSLSDEDAIALWDELVKSLIIRPRSEKVAQPLGIEN